MPQLTLRGQVSEVQEHEVYEALRKVRQARVAGDASADVRWDSPTCPDQVGTSVFMQRMADADRMRARFGIQTAPPVYAPGNVVLSVKDRGFKVLRRSWDEMSEVIDQLQTLWRLIRKEERRTVDVLTSDIQMVHGGLQWGEGIVYPEPGALKQLLSISGLFSSAVTYLSKVDPDLRSINWNRMVREGDAKPIRLRLRRNPLNGQFSVFAVVSQQYGVLDIDHLATSLAESIPSGMRGSVFYDSELTHLRIDAFFDSLYVVDMPSQDLFRSGVQIRSNDVGDGSVWVFPLMMRPLTRACVLMGRPEKSSESPHVLYRGIHQGDMSRVSKGVTEAFSASADSFKVFVDAWKKIRQFGSPYGLGGPLRDDEALRYITTMFLDKLGLGMSEDGLAAHLDMFHRMESAGTAADLVNAVGRLHALPVLDQYQREKLEEASMDILSFFHCKALGSGS